MGKLAWKFYKKFYRGAGFRCGLTVFLSVLQSVAVVPITLVIRLIFDKAIPEKDINRLIMLCLMILSLYIVSGILTLWTRYLSLVTTKNVVKRLRDEMILKIYSLPRSYFSRIDRRLLHARMVQDTLRVDIMSNALVALFVPSLFISIGLLAILIYLNVILFFILILIVPVLFIFNKLMGSQLKVRVNQYHRYFEIFSKRISRILEAMDLTRIQSWEKKETAEQRKIHDRLREFSTSQAWFNGAYQVIQKTTIISMGSLVLVVGGIFVVRGRITLGELFSFFTALGLLRNYLLTMGSAYPGIIEGNESLKALYEIMTIPERLPYGGRKRIQFKGEISFQDVVFDYGSRQILNEISFVLPTHQMVCLRGANGSGKTTIANLILGFYRPERGRILADGHPYDQLDLTHLRRSFGVVQQDPIIFPGTIRENIVYGHSDINESKIREILKMTHCDEFINRFPQGLATPITEKGYSLSGGEIQKISLARALLGNHALLILDEPSNHLEPNVFRDILDKIKKLKSGPTVLIVSQDPSIARQADLVLAIEQGKIKRVEKPN